MALAYYMNEHIPRPITVALRLLEIEVLTTQEDQRAGDSDAELFDRAAELGRVMVSFDADMVRQAIKFQRANTPFPGLVFGHPTQHSIGDCIRDLEIAAKASTPGDLANNFIYLPL